MNIQKLSLLELDPKLLKFRCSETNLIIWPIIRDNLYSLVLSKLYFDNEIVNLNLKSNFFYKLITLYKLLRPSLFLKNLFYKFKNKDILYFKVGYPEENVNNKVFNKTIDYFIPFNQNNYITFSRSPKFSYFKNYFDNEIYYLNFNENIIYLLSKFSKKNKKVSNEITLYLIKKIKKIFNIKLNNREAQRLKDHNLLIINTIEKKLKFYRKIIKNIKPKLAIIENASYSENAILNYALHQLGVRVAEPQHGLISKSHLNYNYSTLIKNNKEYSFFLPDDFLSYGSYWSKKINASFTKQNIGSPHRSQNIIIKKKKIKNKKILLLSDGINLNLMPYFAKKLFFLTNKKYEIFIRPHPRENIEYYKYNQFSEYFKIDIEKNLYKSFLDKEVILSEQSTVLYEALNIVPKIFILRTKKSIFTIPNHPFNEVKNVEELVNKLKSTKTFYLKVKISNYFINNWKKNYINYLKKIDFKKRSKEIVFKKHKSI